MQARSALFDLYGDYLRSRGGRAPVAALVKMLAPLEITAPAVRTAVSRMARQGWLRPMRLVSGPGYLLTPKAVHHLDEAAARIIRTGRNGWDGRFDLILLRAALPRPDAQRLIFLGYGRLSDLTWVSPRATDGIDAALIEAGAEYERFSAAHTAGSPGAAGVVARAWDVAGIGRGYEDFITAYRPVVTSINARSTDEEAYAARFRLVQAWRALAIRDPQLPASLLPPRWPGTSAAGFFDKHASRLRAAADRYVDRCLASVSRNGRMGFSDP